VPSLSHFLDPTLLALLALGTGLGLSSRDALHDVRRRVRVGAALAWGAWFVVWLLASPWFASLCARRLEPAPTDLAAALAGSDPARRVMVVLSGGLKPRGPDGSLLERLYGNSTERIVAAARVYREHGFGHVIVTGASLDDGPRTDMAEAMAQMLVALGVPRDRIHLEPEALDTKQNAIFSARLIRELPVDRIVVVTSALHMPRAVWEFQRAGLTVIAAPVDYEPPPPPGVDAWLPSAGGLVLSHRCVHELLGRLKP